MKLVEFILIVLSVGVFGFQHSGLSTLKVKSRIVKRLGIKGYTRLFTATSVLALLMTIRILNFSDWFYIFTSPNRINLTLFLPGVCLVGLGVVLVVAAEKVLDVSTVADMRSNRKNDLMMSGIYTHIRHPLYLASIMLFSGLALIYPFSKVITFAASFCCYVLIGAYLEERKLILVYGKEYLAYKKKTGFMVPKLLKLI
ncbi:MAG: methyltransferase family protein [Candidatus Heimdallarchaeota archaeon]